MTRERGTMLAIGLACGALTLAGCHPKRGAVHFVDANGTFGYVGGATAPARLDCPAQADDLTRTVQAPDGRSCAYAARDGETVQLSLLALNGQTPQAALAPLEQTLKGQLGSTGASPSASPVHIDADGGHDQANIDLPGFHLHANGDQAVIRLPGVAINADGDRAQVHTGWGSHGAVVDANQNGAEVRAGSVQGGNANLTYILASSRPGPTGLSAAGYIARGPASGPLVVGVFRTPAGSHGHELNDSGLGRLMRLNTGG